MSININVKRNFKINGKEYNSIEEMPPDIRDAFEKALASQAGTRNLINLTTTKTKIVFNGKEYNSIDVMPEDVRQIYEKLLKAAETGTAPADIITASGKNDMPKTYRTIPIGNMGAPMKFEPVFSKRTWVIGVLLITLIILLYFVFHSK